MTDLGERTLKCYLLHTGSISDESEFEDWYQQRHRRLAEELEYKSTLAEAKAKAWLSGWKAVLGIFGKPEEQRRRIFRVRDRESAEINAPKIENHPSRRSDVYTCRAFAIVANVVLTLALV